MVQLLRRAHPRPIFKAWRRRTYAIPSLRSPATHQDLGIQGGLWTCREQCPRSRIFCLHDHRRPAMQRVTLFNPKNKAVKSGLVPHLQQHLCRQQHLGRLRDGELAFCPASALASADHPLCVCKVKWRWMKWSSTSEQHTDVYLFPNGTRGKRWA